MKPVLALALAVFAWTAVTPTVASPQTNHEPEALLQIWLRALAEDDFATYVDCLYSQSRSVPEYGSREAMQFWAAEMDALRKRGFGGRFEIENAGRVGPRLPAGALLARPILDGRAIPDSIVLMREAGKWKILRLFS